MIYRIYAKEMLLDHEGKDLWGSQLPATVPARTWETDPVNFTILFANTYGAHPKGPNQPQVKTTPDARPGWVYCTIVWYTETPEK